MKSKGTLLDFGAGKGHILSGAKDLGWKVNGYEIDCDTAGKLSERLQIEVKCGDINKTGWSNGNFDAIVVHHVLEHLKNPAMYLKNFSAILTDKGIILTVLPNIHSLSSRLKFLLEKGKLRRKNIGFYYDTSHHL